MFHLPFFPWIQVDFVYLSICSKWFLWGRMCEIFTSDQYLHYFFCCIKVCILVLYTVNTWSPAATCGTRWQPGRNVSWGHRCPPASVVPWPAHHHAPTTADNRDQYTVSNHYSSPIWLQFSFPHSFHGSFNFTNDTALLGFLTLVTQTLAPQI